MQNKLIIIEHYGWLLVLLIIISCKSNQTTAIAAVPAYKMYVIESDEKAGTWGYIIECNSHLIIRQFTIPALEGEKNFTSKSQAEKVGTLVTTKLNHFLRPSVSKQELDSMGIIISSADANQK